MQVLNEVNEKIFNFLFSNNSEKIFDCVNSNFQQRLEFEFRFATTIDGHCDNKYWKLYDEYLIPYTGLLDDVIITYTNPKFRIKNTVFREYKYGKLIQKKYCISKFTTDSSNISLIPLIFKLSDETNLQDINDLIEYNKTFSRTFRQQFHINSSNKYLRNWSVDKTIRFISDNYENINVKNINDISSYDILDLEFEYIGEWSELQESLIEVLTFIYLNSEKSYIYKNINKQYLIFNHFVDCKLNNFIIKPKHFDEKMIGYYKLNVPDNFKLRTIIYINDESYAILNEKTIKLINLGNELFNNFSVMSCLVSETKIICTDVYIYELNPIYNENYEIRRIYLNKIIKDSKILNTYEENNSDTIIYYNDDYQKILIIPKIYHVNLKIKLSENKHDFYLYCLNNVPIQIPLIHGNIYSPDETNELSKLMLYNPNKFDNSRVQFQFISVNDELILRPNKILSANKCLNTIYESLQLLFAACIKLYHINSYECKYDDVSILTQLVIENYCINSFNNVYLLIDNNDSFVLKNLLNYSKINNLVIKSDYTNILTNLNKYYNSEYIEPLLKNSNILSNNSSIYCINKNKKISDIDKYYDNDMNYIFIPFYNSDKLSKFARIIDEILINIRVDGSVLLNYINVETDMEKFIFDEILEKDKLYSNDVKYIKHSLDRKNLLVKTKTLINSKTIKKIDNYYYTMNTNNSTITNYLFNSLLVELKNNTIIKDLTLFCLEKLSKINIFKYENKVNFDIDEFQIKIKNDKSLMKKFNGNYNNYKTVLLTF